VLFALSRFLATLKPLGRGAKRLQLPANFIGKVPPIFIDNQPLRQPMEPRNAFQDVMLLQHTYQKRKVCCVCCDMAVRWVPDEYAVAKGPVSDDAEVLLTGKYNLSESCGCGGWCWLCPWLNVGAWCLRISCCCMFETYKNTS
jgi:hypothetical protein